MKFVSCNCHFLSKTWDILACSQIGRCIYLVRWSHITVYLSLSLSTMPDDTEVVEGNKKTVEKNISFCCCDKCQGKEVSLATFYNHGYITGDQDNPRVTWVILRKHQRKKPRNVRYSLTIMYNYNWYDLNRIRRIKVEKHLLPRDSLPHPKFWNLAVRILMMRRIMIQMMIASV